MASKQCIDDNYACGKACIDGADTCRIDASGSVGDVASKLSKAIVTAADARAHIKKQLGSNVPKQTTVDKWASSPVGLENHLNSHIAYWSKQKPVVKSEKPAQELALETPQIATKAFQPANIIATATDSAEHNILPLAKAGTLTEELSSAMQRLSGLDESDAEADFSALRAYTGNDEDCFMIRKADSDTFSDIDDNEYANNIAREQAAAINAYITKAPVFGEPIYRGLSFGDKRAKADFIAQAEAGEMVLPSMSSFSSNMQVAHKFGGQPSVSVKLIVKEPRSGATIRSISSISKEDQVLVPKGARYKLSKKIEQDNGDTWLELEQHID